MCALLCLYVRREGEKKREKEEANLLQNNELEEANLVKIKDHIKKQKQLVNSSRESSQQTRQTVITERTHLPTLFPFCQMHPIPTPISRTKNCKQTFVKAGQFREDKMTQA